MQFLASEGYFWPLAASMRSKVKKYDRVKPFKEIQWNKVFCRMYGLAVIEVMILSGHLTNIDEILSKYETAKLACTQRQKSCFPFSFYFSVHEIEMRVFR